MFISRNHCIELILIVVLMLKLIHYWISKRLLSENMLVVQLSILKKIVLIISLEETIKTARGMVMKKILSN